VGKLRIFNVFYYLSALYKEAYVKCDRRKTLMQIKLKTEKCISIIDAYNTQAEEA
jgi:uncharacterized membrane protein YobD (UPF0266 family)